MEEQFILRVPPEIAERINKVLDCAPDSSADVSMDLSFQDARSALFTIGQDRFPAALLDLPTVVESWKSYDGNAYIKTADVGQMILVRGANQPPPDSMEHPHGLTPPMYDARRRRFRRNPDIDPELVSAVEKDLQTIIAGGGTAKERGGKQKAGGGEGKGRAGKKLKETRKGGEESAAEGAR